VGAGSGDLLRIFLLQTLGLGLAGGLLGVAAGVGVMAALPAVFGKLLPVHAVLEFPWRSALAGWERAADDAAVLPAAAAGCARGAAGAGAAQAGGAGA
jgi:ABC-type antimicrobial peptide transport system permease subunit